MQDSQLTEFKGDILIVDDVLPNLKALSMLLEEKSYAVRGALSGSSALRMIDAQLPDLVLLDIRMPEMNGYDVCRRLKADEKTRNIPVIFISAASELTEKMQGFAVGGVDYITKPIQAEEVLARVKTHLTLRNLQAQLEAQNAQLRHEIAERKRAEVALQRAHDDLEQQVNERTAELRSANAELASAVRLKDEFLAAMSHELRTPLNAILGLSEALQDQVYGSLNEKQLKSLRTIETSGGRLLALINNILDMAKIGAGQLELQIAPFYVEQVCEASLEAIKQAARKKRLRVASTFDSAVTTIQVDGRRLKQILINMLSNAVKFTPEDGAIGLEVAGDIEGEAVHFTVWDTGVGISQKDMRRLFGGPGPQPFVQLDSSLARRYEGTGLGLALVRHLTEMHGGGVTVESEVGKGSRFTVSLPWRTEDEKASERESARISSPPVSSSSRPPVTVLLAEDNESNLNTIAAYLSALEYRVVSARNGVEAVARAKEEQPDVILMDVQMPGMDGVEATRRIRTDDRLADIPIIALTALAMPGDRERCLEVGVNEYLSKPVNLKQLVGIIEAQLSE